MHRIERLLVPVACSVASLALVWQSAVGTDSALIVVFGLALGLFGALIWVAWEAWARKPDHAARWTARAFFAASLAFVASIAVWHWPLRAAFALWRQPLEELYARVERGERVPVPVRVGTFVFQRVEIYRDSYPALVLNTDPAGPTMLIRSADVPGNEWSLLRLEDDWMLFSED